MKISRLFLVILCIVLVLGSRKGSSSAEFSCSSLKLVVPYSPGGRSDTVARIWRKISQKYMSNINIVVQNLPGGGGSLGTIYVKDSAPDGCTLLVATITNLIIRAKSPGVRYTYNDFKPIGQISSKGSAIITRGDFPIRTFNELIRHAKKNPGQLTYSGAYLGMIHMDILLRKAGINLTPKRYISVSKSFSALVSGEVNLAITPITEAIRKALRSKQLLPLAIINDSPDPFGPQIPLVSQFNFAGIPQNWIGIVAPRRTPGPALASIRRVFEDSMIDVEISKALKDVGESVDAEGHQEFQLRWQRDDKSIQQVNLCAGCSKDNCPAGCDKNACCQ